MKGKRRSETGRKRRSLQKITLIMLVSLLLFFCGTFLLAIRIMSKNAEDDFRMRTAETAVDNAAASIEASLLNYNYLTRLLMINPRIVDFLKADHIDADLVYEARHGIYEIQNLYSYIDSVYVFRNDGQYACTGRADYTIDMECEEHQRILDAWGSTVVAINGNGMIEKRTSEQLLTLSRAVYDINSQKLIGMLIMNVSGRYFEDIMKVKGQEGICILDRDGTVLCGDWRIGVLYNRNFDSEETIFRRAKIDGKEMYLAGKRAVEPIVVLGVCGSVTRSMPYKTMLALAIPMTAFLIAILFCAAFMTMQITGPVRSLGEAMKKTRSSGWMEQIDVAMPNDELGYLEDSYNAVIQYLNELFNRILENEKNVQRIEMRVLQEQIKPHFLYNTLETISYLAVQESASKTHDALETLGNFYRNFLSKGKREIPLRLEVRIAHDYLSLQKLRYGDIIQDEYDIDEDALDCMIPKLILQPLVENSIYHGIRLTGERGVIRICARRMEQQLQLSVYDTGIGMSEEEIDRILHDTTTGDEQYNKGGFGLRGTINRIRYFCDDENAVAIHSCQGEYTQIEITVPVKMVEDMEDENDKGYDHR